MKSAGRASRSRLMALAAGGLLVLAACGSDDDGAQDLPVDSPVEASTVPTDTPVATSPATTTGEGSEASSVPEALDFSAPLVGGGEIEMGEYAGRPVLLWFWAPW